MRTVDDLARDCVKFAEDKGWEVCNGTDAEQLALARAVIERGNRVAALEAENERLRGAISAYLEAYPHEAPRDCFATGPLTGDPFKDLVHCPGCAAEKLARAALARREG